MKIGKCGQGLIALLTAAAMLLSGCGMGNISEGEGAQAEGGAGAQMGRYVEELAEIDAQLGKYISLTRLKDGRLAVYSYNNGPRVSSDEGITWEPWQEEWYQENFDNRSFSCVAISPDGTMFTGYFDFSKAEGEQENLMEYQLIEPDGSSRMVALEQLNGSRGDNIMAGCWYAPDGTLYAADLCFVYEVPKEGGTLVPLFEAGEGVEQICFLEDDTMLVATATGVLLYDRKSRAMKESDEILDAFVKDRAELNGGVLKYDGDGSYNVYLAAGEGSNLYLVCDEGIYCHTLGGGMVEKLLEGSLCTLGDPSRGIYGMLPLEDNRFLVMYQDEVGTYSYDADIPALPEKELRVYSLKKDDVVQQAVSLFQKANPDVYVNYEVGLDENTGQTKEDVIKTLNTEILAGHGPDVLILDGFPMDSYTEKGLLADLSDIFEQPEEKEEVYYNIAGAFEEDGKLRAIPMRCKIPAIIGPAEELEKADSLEKIADASESLRKKKESGSVTGTKGEKPTLQLLAMSCAPAWENSDGSVNLEAVEEFFVQAQRVFAAESVGLTRMEQEAWSEVYLSGPNGEMRTDAWALIDNNAYYAFAQENRMGMGYINDMWSMEILLSACRGRDGFWCDTLKGQSEQVFYPYTIAGISASSKEAELAKEFVKTMLSKEAASAEGFSVNKAAMAEIIEANDGGDGTFKSAMQGTNEMQMPIYNLTSGEVDRVYAMLEHLKTPYLQNETLEAAVLETGEKLLGGELDVKSALEEVQSRVKLSMAE